MGRTRKQRQLELPIRTWGGVRRGAGRPPAGRVAGVSHLRRPTFASRHPVHVTLRVQDGLPSLRRTRMYRRLVGAISAGKARLGGRVVHFSVQDNHLHFLVEAAGADELSRFVQGLSIRIARAVNAAASRRGRVFADRFHARPLKTPREVKNAVAYVLGNERKHAAERGVLLVGVLDGYSSAAWFSAWTIPDARERGLGLSRAGPMAECPVAPARTWLLREGWMRHGRIDPNRVPG